MTKGEWLMQVAVGRPSGNQPFTRTFDGLRLRDEVSGVWGKTEPTCMPYDMIGLFDALFPMKAFHCSYSRVLRVQCAYVLSTILIKC